MGNSVYYSGDVYDEGKERIQFLLYEDLYKFFMCKKIFRLSEKRFHIMTIICCQHH